MQSSRSLEFTHLTEPELYTVEEQLPILPSAPSPWQPPFSSLLLEVRTIAFSDTSWKWRHAPSVCDWLLSLTIMPITFNHVVTHSRISFFLRDE